MLKKQFRKLTAIALSSTLLFALPGINAIAATVSDINGHWAQAAITSWVNVGYISGYSDGTFQPDKNITRAEFATLINNAFGGGSISTRSFSDLPSSHWAYANLLKAVGKGYISGYPDGTIKPDANITREEAAAMIAQSNGISTNSDITSTYNDAWKISNWSKPYINAVSQFEYMKGFPDGSFRPQTPLTRAEAVMALSKARGAITVAPTTPGNTNSNVNNGSNTSTTVAKDYTVSANETSIKNKTIEGRLIFPSSLNSASITLENVTVKGETVVSGGKKITANGCKFQTVTLDKKDVEFETNKTSTVSKLIFGKNGLITGYGFTDVEVDDNDLSTVRIDAEVKNLTVDREVDVKLLSDALITTLTAKSKSEDTEVNFTRGAEVKNFDIHDVIKITGRGDIGTMTVYVSDVRSSITPDRLLKRDGASAPKYTDSSSSSSNDGSKYDNLTIDKEDKRFDGDGDKYNNVKIDAEGVEAKDLVVYGDLTITKNVGDGEVTLEDVEVRGDVLIYGGGDNSIIFDNCTIKGDIYSDTSNKNVSSSKQDDPVALKFDSSTVVDGTVHIRGNTILDSTGSSSSFSLDNVIIDREYSNGPEVEINVRINSLEITRKCKVKLKYKSLGDLKVSSGAAGTTFDISNGGVISSATTEGKITFSGKGTINKLTDKNNSATLGSGVTVDSTQTPSGGVSSVTLAPTSAIIDKGKTVQLTATVLPTTATNKAVTYSSDNPTIATVSQTGLVTGVTDGNAIITVKTTDGAKTATCTVTVGSATPPVNPNPPTGNINRITLNPQTTSIVKGETANIVATTDPVGATISWVSSNPKVVSVDQTGKITAVGTGSITITATAKGATTAGNKTATCKVTVTDTFGVSSSVINLKIGGNTGTIKAQNIPAGDAVTWTLNTQDVVKLSDTAGTTVSLTPLKAGQTTLTATSTSGKKATVAITVFDMDLTEEDGKAVEKIILPVGSSKQLKSVVEPDKEVKDVIWSSNNIDVAVDKNGKVTALALPKTTAEPVKITARVNSNTATSVIVKTCEVEVTPAFSIDKPTVNLVPIAPNNAFTVSALNIPTGDSLDDLEWKCEPSDALTITKDGVGKAKITATKSDGTATAPGVYTVTATSKSGRTAKCTVNVFGITIVGEKGETIVPNSDMIMLTNQNYKIQAIVTPDKVSNVALTFESNADRVYINETTGEMKAKVASDYPVTITAKLTIAGATQPLLTTSFKVTVSAAFNVSPTAMPLDLKNKTTGTFTANNKPKDYTVEWTTADESIATVERTTADESIATVNKETGAVTAKKVGATTISALAVPPSGTGSIITATADVTVFGLTLADGNNAIADDGNGNVSMFQGEEKSITATVLPSTYATADRKIEWTSSDSTVIKVVSSPTTTDGRMGVLTALKDTGTTPVTITATLKIGTQKITETTFTVTSTKNFVLDETQLKMAVDGTATLKALNAPAGETVTWTSDSLKVKVSEKTTLVDEHGTASITVTAEDYGTATITATVGDKSASCTVNVYKLVNFLNVITLTKGVESTITANLQPAAEDLRIKWSVTGDKGSDDSYIVSYTTDDKGNLKITPLRIYDVDATTSESVKITATVSGLSNNQNFSETCDILIKDGPTKVIGVKINDKPADNKPIIIEKGQATSLTAAITPPHADNKTIVWNSSNDKYVTVDPASGLITGKAVGTAVISVETADGKFTDMVSIQVNEPTVIATGITLTSNNLILWKDEKNNTGSIKADLLPKGITNKNITWRATDNTIVSVEGNNATGTAIIMASKGGETTITATSESNQAVLATCKVIVKVPTTDITIAPKNNDGLNVTKGTTKQFIAKTTPEESSASKVTWTISPTTIATITSDSGIVTPVSEGTATITATIAAVENNNKKVTESIVINVVNVGVDSVSLPPTETLDLTTNKTKTLTATIAPENATNKTVTWTSSVPQFATVDSSTGKVTAVATGTTTITATSNADTTKKATCTVTVTGTAVQSRSRSATLPTDITAPVENKNPEPISPPTPSVSEKRPEPIPTETPKQTETKKEETKKEETKTEPTKIAVQSITLQASGSGKTTTLKPVITPENATNKNVSWQSSDTGIARVDQKGVVTAVGEGSAVITATTEDGGKTATYDINIQQNKVEIKSISMPKTLPVGIGAVYKMTPTIYPKNATNQNLNWESSDTSVATVSADGTITALKAGVVMITASSPENDKSATTNIVVKDMPLSRIAVNKPRLSMVTGQSQVLSVVTTPTAAATGTLQWVSNNPALVSVDQTGKVTALGKTPKPVTITVKSTTTGKFATSVVTVTK